jgi:hypothetical protein
VHKNEVHIHEKNINERAFYFSWDPKKLIVSYEETPDIVILDYSTYIGGLFELWFGICLENFLIIW